MANGRTVLAVDACGRPWWFSETDARTWMAADGRLYRIGDAWAVRTELDTLTGQPARVIGDAEALQWLALHGFAIPDALAAMAETTRLGRVKVGGCARGVDR